MGLQQRKERHHFWATPTPAVVTDNKAGDTLPKPQGATDSKGFTPTKRVGATEAFASKKANQHGYVQ